MWIYISLIICVCVYLHFIIKHIRCPIRQRLKMKLHIWSQLSNYIICFLLIKCICVMHRSLNLVKIILTTCAATRYVTIKIEQILKFSNIFICFFFLFPYFFSSIEKTPPSIFLFLCFLTSSSFLYGSNGIFFYFLISLSLFLYILLWAI